MSLKKHNNIEACQLILKELAHFGLSEIVYCAGSRNAPFIRCLGELENTRIYSFFEERSAAFFALGRCRALQKPVAVVTTSGTAAAELLPACIEAYYSGAPLVFITADRPSRLRFTGAPQCIDQSKFMSSFVEQSFDLENRAFTLAAWSQRAPLHINLCIDEPIIDAELGKWTLPQATKFRPTKLNKADNQEVQQKMSAAGSKCERPLIILGSLDGEKEIEAARKICLALQWPTYAEGGSGLRESPTLKQFLIHGGEQFTCQLFKKFNFDLVLRLGSIPTTRLWRDLELAGEKTKVLSVSPLAFSGLSDSIFLHSDLASFCESVNWTNTPKQMIWQKQIALLDKEQSEFNESLLQKYPRSEPALVRKISELVEADELFYIGNSLPIREWDLAATYERPKQIFANRGANGIDGQLSSYLGMTATSAGRSWCLLGDLTALYDLAAPWALKSVSNKNQKIVILNNGGGQIFHRIYNDPLFENSHDLDFSHWAKMWRLDYQLWKGKTFEVLQPNTQVLEVVPDAEETQNFWNELSEFVKK